MGDRKQPFGYRVVMGEIVTHPQEAELVEYIIQKYLAGAVFSTLLEELREQSIPYNEGKVWYKNMVARILEDQRYIGEHDYLPVIDREILTRALAKRRAKHVPSSKTQAQKMLRRLSEPAVTKSMEVQVLNLLNSLVTLPDRVKLPETMPSNQSEVHRLQHELEQVMEGQPIEEEKAQKLILSMAAAQYTTIVSCEYETVRLRGVLSRHAIMTELDAELLQSTVAAIHCYTDGTLDVYLKNDQIIGRGDMRLGKVLPRASSSLQSRRSQPSRLSNGSCVWRHTAVSLPMMRNSSPAMRPSKTTIRIKS